MGGDIPVHFRRAAAEHIAYRTIDSQPSLLPSFLLSRRTATAPVKRLDWRHHKPVM
jgi:hypothetical protein